MKIKFYGVRGSYPVPSKDTVEFGGNTSCVTFTKEIKGKIHRIIVDSGTGIINLGKDIINNYFQRKEKLNINMFFTHLHPDHTEGFPFFVPAYFKDANINIFGMETLKQHVGKVLERNMLPPCFPLEYISLKSKRKHYKLQDDNTIYITYNNQLQTHKDKECLWQIDVMQSYAPSHPQQGSMYYKITELEEQKTVACIWDLESIKGGDMRVINFCKNSNVLIHDTQYTEEEYYSDKNVVQGFGHSTYEMAIENALKANIHDMLICTHYNPTHSDDKLTDIQEKYNSHNAPFYIYLAKEGMEFTI